MAWNIGDKVEDVFPDASYIWRFSLLKGVVRFKKFVVTKTTPKKIFIAEVRSEDGSMIIYDTEQQIFKSKINQLSEGVITNQTVAYSDSENEGKALIKLALMKEILRLEKEVEDAKDTLNKTKELLERVKGEVG